MKNIGRKFSVTGKKCFRKQRIVNHISNSAEKSGEMWSEKQPLELEAGVLLLSWMEQFWWSGRVEASLR